MLVVSLRRAFDAVSNSCSAGVMDDYVGPRLSLVAAQMCYGNVKMDMPDRCCTWLRELIPIPAADHELSSDSS